MATSWKSSFLKRHIALPQDHGSWVFLLSPLLIGLASGGRWRAASGLVVLAALSAFLIRQPITIAVKVYSGRRPRRDLAAARFWTAMYGFLGLMALTGLILEGFSYLLWLALPGIPVFAWHLYLVSHRAERRQLGVEIVASGVLALAAPAGLWVGLGHPAAQGWLLWALVWLQSAASIVHAYMRLAQRELFQPPWDMGEVMSLPPRTRRFQLGQRALLYTTFNLALTLGLSLTTALPDLLFVPYGLQWVETLLGALRPAIHQRPTQIGVRQLIISTLFTGLFILAWYV